MPIRAQAVVPLFTDLSPEVKQVTMAGVTCTLWIDLLKYFPTPWQSEVVCTDATGKGVQLQVRFAGEEMHGGYVWPSTAPVDQRHSIMWILQPGPTPGSTTGMKLSMGALPAPTTGTPPVPTGSQGQHWERTF